MINMSKQITTVVEAKRILEDAGYLGIYWSKNDLQNIDRLDFEQDETRDYPLLTNEQIDKLAERIVHLHDYAVGLSWDILKIYIQEFIYELK